MACGNQVSDKTPHDYFADATGGESTDATAFESECDNQALCWIKQHPVAAIAIALAVGLLLGRR